MSIKTVLAASAATVAFVGMASAATVDFTDNDVYDKKSNFEATGTTDGVGWSVTSIPTGELSYSDFDGTGVVSPLANDFDGIGVDDDEISNTGQFITVTFDQEVNFTGAQFLDLFFDPETEEQEMVQIWFGTDTSGAADVTFMADEVFQTDSGYFAGEFSWTGNVLTFGAAIDQNDGQGVGDYALAAISFESAVIPLPAAGFLLLGGLGGLAAMKRRKK